jgi:ABC-type transport system involved in multi-copper enzyme maturation permease subunit
MSAAPHRMVQEQQHWVDRAATWFADRCSPILVKESRQAMKSWQFQGTFLLLLLFVVGWSYLAVSLTLYEGMEESGGVLLTGYLWILGFPLGVVLPLAAFRSLAREFEDETIQLISITTMSARRIVLGKLGSAVLQMIVYLAAVVPCLAFSYLLRGVDLTQIFQLLTLGIFGSLSLVCVGLMLAGFARFGWLAVILNLLLLVVVGVLYMMWCSFNAFVGQAGLGREFQAGIGFVVAFMVSTAYLAFECAVSLISFPSEDRSSRIRLAVSLQVLVFSAVMVAAIGTTLVGGGDLDEFFCYLSAWISHYLCLVGAMMVSEQSGVSQRVRRSLPTTLLGRVIWGLYLPGPGRGYLFTIAVLWGWNIAIGLMLTFSWNEWFGLSSDGTGIEGRWISLLLNLEFGTIYLSLVYLFMLCFGASIRYGRILAGMLLVTIMYAVVAIICTSVDAFVYRDSIYYRTTTYEYAQRFNWPVAFYRATTDGSALSYVDVTIFLGIVAGAMALLCAYFATKEWVITPVMVPERVREENRRQSNSAGSVDPLSDLP